MTAGTLNAIYWRKYFKIKVQKLMVPKMQTSVGILFVCEPTQNVFARSGRPGVLPGRHPQGNARAKGGIRVRNPLGDALRTVQEGNRKIIQKLK